MLCTEEDREARRSQGHVGLSDYSSVCKSIVNLERSERVRSLREG